MKCTIFILSTLLSSSVLAAGPMILKNRFSRDTMKKWQIYLSKDSKLDTSYQRRLEQGQIPSTCPETLKEADIQLVSAWGDYENGSDDWARKVTVDTGKLNAIEFVYNVNDGRCGKITVVTEPKKGFFGSTSYEWKDPDYATRADRTVPITRNEEIAISAGSAYKLAVEKFPMLTRGFRGMGLVKAKKNGGYVLQYVFRGLAGDDSAFTTIHVSVADSKVWKSAETEAEAANLQLDHTALEEDS